MHLGRKEEAKIDTQYVKTKSKVQPSFSKMQSHLWQKVILLQNNPASSSTVFFCGCDIMCLGCSNLVTQFFKMNLDGAL